MGYAWLANAMNEGSDGLYERLAALPPGQVPEIERSAPPVPPAPPAPPPPSVAPPRPDFLATLRQFLKPEIDQGVLGVFGDGRSITVRIRNRGLFDSGSATVAPDFIPMLQRIGEGLRQEPGSVLMHRPLRQPADPHGALPLQLPPLPGPRAEAAAAVIIAANGDPGRFTTEGRADAEPLADNRTAEGREQNRRIEVVLMRGGN